jgi:hypothetical protein
LAQFAVGKKSTKACNLGSFKPRAGKGLKGQKVFFKEINIIHPCKLSMIDDLFKLRSGVFMIIQHQFIAVQKAGVLS